MLFNIISNSSFLLIVFIEDMFSCHLPITTKVRFRMVTDAKFAIVPMSGILKCSPNSLLLCSDARRMSFNNSELRGKLGVSKKSTANQLIKIA